MYLRARLGLPADGAQRRRAGQRHQRTLGDAGVRV